MGSLNHFCMRIVRRNPAACPKLASCSCCFVAIHLSSACHSIFMYICLQRVRTYLCTDIYKKLRYAQAQTIRSEINARISIINKGLKSTQAYLTNKLNCTSVRMGCSRGGEGRHQDWRGDAARKCTIANWNKHIVLKQV